MGQHKHNPVAIAAKRGELPPKKNNAGDTTTPPRLSRKTALLASTMAAIMAIGGGPYNGRR